MAFGTLGETESRTGRSALILRCSKTFAGDPANGQWQLSRLVCIGATGMQASESALSVPKKKREDICTD
jgi:hypothetical protein